MSRKATITQKEIVNAAFKITKKEGFEQITSRKLAAAAGCSTQPIFRIYENMDGLKKDVYDKAAAYYEDYYNDFNKTHDTPFVDLGLAYIGFAQKYPHLFRLLFISGQEPGSRTMYDLVNGSNENVVHEINKAMANGAGNAQQLFMQMWIFIHGAGCMAVTGDYDLDEAASVDMLTAAYKAFSIV
ncbi:TetR/AcrR family transcriptional regulator [Butyrivibrio sp. YAB3001]|uniref:TetR/AcrR family transcriptional regulator n=1 Tax=Butyrivibrio sp. YAB3001 TaxID=1520812 RepID=UPI0008F63ABD|nr:TetR/AcrR family transcriptional regulator [Butyrivibrio sp. YAB3001]SFB75701.1 DNA-binding transcriptional regulator, AcrR family [Butyrivibrio sp. YAB3001]